MKNQLQSKEIVLYGMGYIGKYVAQLCDKNNIKYIFSDTNAINKMKNSDKKVILPEKLVTEYKNATIVITSINYYDEIKEYLNSLGIDDERIISYLSIWPEIVQWQELENSVDWNQVRERAQIFAAWIDPSSKSVTDYSFEKNFLKEFIHKEMVYISPEYFSIIENVPVASFSSSEKYQLTDASSCLAMLMSFRNPDEVIDHICEYTDKMIVASYVPLENMSHIRFRRSINYNNDFTEDEFLSKFSKHGFIVERKAADPFDSVHIVYKFIKQS